MSNPRSAAGSVLALIVVLVVLFVLRSSLFVIDERERAVILEFGRPVKSINESGLYFKMPVIQEVRRLPRTLLFWNSREDIVDLPTADGKKVEISAWAVWKINDPLKFVQTLRTVNNGEQTVGDRVRAAIRDEISSHDLAEVVRSSSRELTYSFRFVLPTTEQPESTSMDAPVENQPPTELKQPGQAEEIELGREKILEAIIESVRKRLEGDTEDEIDRGVQLVDVGISRISFVPSVQEAAFERLKAFMDSIASGYTHAGEQRKQEILNKTQAEVEEIIGNGEREANIIRGRVDAEIIEEYARAINETGDLYSFLKQLEVYESALRKGTRLILTTDSELFRLLKDSSIPMTPGGGAAPSAGAPVEAAASEGNEPATSASSNAAR